MSSFQRQVKGFAEKYEKRLRATMRGAVQETVDRSQLIRDKGGRMRVNLGFLRASIVAGLGRMPSGPVRNEDKASFALDTFVAGESVAATLLRWDGLQPLYVGWTAEYARIREREDGFMRGATEKWPEIVDKTAREVRARI